MNLVILVYLCVAVIPLLPCLIGGRKMNKRVSCMSLLLIFKQQINCFISNGFELANIYNTILGPLRPL